MARLGHRGIASVRARSPWHVSILATVLAALHSSSPAGTKAYPQWTSVVAGSDEPIHSVAPGLVHCICQILTSCPAAGNKGACFPPSGGLSALAPCAALPEQLKLLG